MKKYVTCIVFLGLSYLPAYSQNITAAFPAKLQVYFMKTDGTQAVMSSEKLSVAYDQLKMNGELMINTLESDDASLKSLLDSAAYDKITFAGIIPEGQFVFQSTMNNRFSVESEILYGELQSRILISYDINNRNTSNSNTFDITCTGSISLSENLGITRNTGLDDKVSFQFFQNVQTKTY